VRAGRRDVIVKAAGNANHHIGREIAAHESYTAPLVGAGRAARMLHADRDANLLVLGYLPGRLAEASDAEFSPDVHAQAGELLRLLHAQTERMDDDYESRITAKVLGLLDREHRIDPEAARESRRVLLAYRPRPVRLVPTHGDWHPRNWLVHRGVVEIIDFGRFDLRPAATDLCRLAVQQWRVAPALESAFLEGYGRDPRDPEVWAIDLLREAVATAVWAYRVGDTAFEAHGHRMLDEALERF
jgi:aminoglycoside/choline kinase family phosphotransferase